MIAKLNIGATLRCDGCGTEFVFRGLMVESVHVRMGDGLLDFHSRRCFFTCLARGGALTGGRTILLIDRRTPAESLTKLFQHHGIDPNDVPQERLVETVQQIDFARRR